MPTPDAERVWWARVRRAAAAQGNAGSKLLSDHSHEYLAAIADRYPDGAEFPSADPDVLAEQRRATERLGVALGVGPLP